MKAVGMYGETCFRDDDHTGFLKLATFSTIRVET